LILTTIRGGKIMTNITVNEVKSLIHLAEEEALSSLFNNEEEFIEEGNGHMEYQQVDVEGGQVSRSRHWRGGERICGRSGEWKYGTINIPWGKVVF
jgi:hypothetical protein